MLVGPCIAAEPCDELLARGHACEEGTDMVWWRPSGHLVEVVHACAAFPQRLVSVKINGERSGDSRALAVVMDLRLAA